MFSRDASIPGDAALGYIHKSFVALLRTSIAGRSFPIPITREQVTAIFQSALSWYAWESADSGVLGGKRKQAGLGPEDATFGQEDVTHPCGESRGWTFEKGAAVSGYDSRLEQQENVHEGIESSREESGEESDSSVEVVFP